MKSFLYPFLFTVALCAFAQSTIAQGDLPFIASRINPESEINCLSNPETIGITIENWIPGITYTWNTSESDSLIEVKPIATSSYSVTIAHPNYSQVQVKTFLVEVKNNPITAETKQLFVGNDRCPGSEIEISATATGGHGALTYNWDNGKTDPTIIVQPLQSSIYYFTATDECMTHQEGKIEIDLEEQPLLLSPELQEIDFVCSGEQFEVAPNMNEVSGGIGFGYKYSMGIGLNINTPLVIQPEDGKILIATVTDACGIQKNQIHIQLIKRDPVLPSLEDQQVCDGAEVEFTQSTDYQLYFWNDGQMYSSYKQQISQDQTINLTYFDECSDKHNVQKNYIIDDIQSSFEYYTSIGSNDVRLSGEPLQDATYRWYINGMELSTLRDWEYESVPGYVNEVTLVTTNKNGCRSTITRNFVIRDGIDAPNAISPNGDGYNDVFRVSILEEVQDFKIEIYNRWGQLIFKSHDQYFTWNGQDGNSDNMTSFAYRISGVSEQGIPFNKNGTITLIRTN
jgi:gliding motility-associated-like protein